MPILTYHGAMKFLDQGYILDWPDRTKKAVLQKPSGDGFIDTDNAITSKVAQRLLEDDLLVSTNVKLTRFLKRRPPTAHDKVQEVTQFQTTDGKFWPTMDEACDHQETIDFRTWCDENLCRGGEWSASMVADAVLEKWRMTPR